MFKISSTLSYGVPNTDHRGVEIEVNSGMTARGPSYWKFNESLLKDVEYITLINNKIDLCKHALNDLPAQLQWDYCKAQIKDCSIAYSKQKALNKRNDILHLRLKLKELQSKISNCLDTVTDDAMLNEMKDTKLALDLYALHEAKGAQTRARMRWIESGERNTKYFLGLEKSNHNNKIMASLKNNNGDIATSKEEIMEIQLNFYKALYGEKFDFDGKKNEFENFCGDIDIPKLNEMQSESCEGMVNVEDAGFALSLMKNDSAPGCDGLTASFFKFFWIHISEMVINSFNEAFIKGQMSVSQRRAIITLIHKGKNLARDEIGNWRPSH